MFSQSRQSNRVISFFKLPFLCHDRLLGWGSKVALAYLFGVRPSVIYKYQVCTCEDDGMCLVGYIHTRNKDDYGCLGRSGANGWQNVICISIYLKVQSRCIRMFKR